MSVLEKKLFKPELLSALFQRRERDAASTPVSQIITGGTIRPLINGSSKPVDAIGIHQGKVIAVGRLSDVEAAMNAQGLTGYQVDPYACRPANNHGLFNFTDPNQDQPTEVPDAYRSLIKAAMGKGWPLMIHANGDQAVRFTLQVYDEAISKQQAGARRHRIEHCSLLVPEQITTMRDKGISPSFLIGHVGYWGHAFRQVIFKDKAEQHLDLCRSALDAGLRISLHSDCEVSPLGPLRMMEQSITRIMEAAPPTEGGKPPALNPYECITKEQALRAVTYDAAWQCYADKWVGSLDTGHFADFVILAQDPLTLGDCYLKMRDIPVVETWKDGIRVYTGATAGTK
ncbi:amidohydrolase family protein [Melittangium boletus]|uniref:amidohydrolase family protein n=1 Tax=Melittangium boletus TaxID=83453 RepID=UPI0012FD1AB6|nr:amidohydrolase family protein [Melittangium boletus]